MSARRQQLRPLLSRCLAARGRRHPVPHRDHEGWREEQADLAELDFLGVVVIAPCAG
jgi:hypothetical protein